jgi:hypothetical protein
MPHEVVPIGFNVKSDPMKDLADCFFFCEEWTIHYNNRPEN